MQESAENYLETILLLSTQLDQVRSIDVVNETGFSKPSISEAMKKLKHQNLIEINEHGHISFTQEGKEKAEKILERHHTISKALINLGVPAQIAEEDACKIEHFLSEISFQKIKIHIEKHKNS